MSLNWIISLKDRGKKSKKKKVFETTTYFFMFFQPRQSWQGETAHSRTAFPGVGWICGLEPLLFGQKELEIRNPSNLVFIVLNGGTLR